MKVDEFYGFPLGATLDAGITISMTKEPPFMCRVDVSDGIGQVSLVIDDPAKLRQLGEVLLETATNMEKGL